MAGVEIWLWTVTRSANYNDMEAFFGTGWAIIVIGILHHLNRVGTKYLSMLIHAYFQTNDRRISVPGGGPQLLQLQGFQGHALTFCKPQQLSSFTTKKKYIDCKIFAICHITKFAKKWIL